MKALIIEETVYEGTIAYIHGMSNEAKRILIPEKNNLVITPHEEEIYIWEGFEFDKRDCKKIREIEIPSELVERALSFLQQKKEFYQLKDEFEKLLS